MTCPASRFLSGAPKSVKLKLKGGAYVDPESAVQDKVTECYHCSVLTPTPPPGSCSEGRLCPVQCGPGGCQHTGLGVTGGFPHGCLQDGKNSYYKLQVLEHDKKAKWSVTNLD